MTIFTKFELLDSFPIKKQQEIIKSLPVLVFENNQPIFWEGDKTNDIYFILSGATKSYTESANGRRVYFKTRKAGEILGYYSGFTGLPRSATMVAVGKTKLACMSSVDFMNLVCKNPALSQYCLKLLGNLLRNETVRLTNIITLSVKDRVINYILSYSNDLQYVITLSSREDLASYLNTTRETLSRVLNQLEKKLCLQIKKKQIIVLDKNKLENELSVEI